MSQTLRKVKRTRLRRRRRRRGRTTTSMWRRRSEQRTERKGARTEGPSDLTHPAPGGEGPRVTTTDGRMPMKGKSGRDGERGKKRRKRKK